ncbi:MAG TPA: hypothetical protein VFU46_04150 [Gemmatimonadales bacterium]|nr:hypothetical protein [Gemmatimonadales bacterium]
MSTPGHSLFRQAAAAAVIAVPAAAQDIALPLRGEGQLALPGKQYDVHYGSVLFQADGKVKILFPAPTVPRTTFAGVWRRGDQQTIHVALHSVLGGRRASGTGRIHLRPDGAIDELELRGRTDGRGFWARFDNGAPATTIAGSELPETAELSPSRRPDDNWGGNHVPPVLDVARSGEGRLRDFSLGDYRLARARLRLGHNGEFRLDVSGETGAELAGTWSGDLRQSPIRLDVREASGRGVQGMGRAWIRDRSWDRDRSFERVELDWWDGDRGFALYFEAEAP